METYARFEKSIVLVALLFNVLVTSFPKELSADVGAIRGTASNLAASVGTVVIGALVVGVTEHRGYKRPDRQTACVLDAVKYSCRVQNVDVIGAGGIGVALGGALAGWNVTMVDINEAKLEAGRRYGIEINGVKESNLHFMPFAEWTSADRAILLLCTKTYDNPVVLARIPLRHLLVPIQNGFDPVLNRIEPSL